MNLKSTLLSVLTVLALAPAALAQTVINAYARVTAQSSTSLTLSNVSGTFAAGDQVLLMQMQDNVIGTTSNTSSFGDLGSIASAGLYERATLTAATGSSATLAAVPGTSFCYSANCRVQMVSFPDLGAGGNYSTTAALGALAWDGNRGGVLAFRVTGTLTLNHSLTASGRGFRGGSPNPTAGYISCDAGNYINNSPTTDNYGLKGEGIYNANGSYTLARGKILTGGGGGNDTNAGGGGGGNYTAGGAGGQGWTGSTTGCAPGAGGQGGLDMSSSISSTRFFMGGGGGGGQQNNNVATSGGAGGGIIIVRANVLTTVPGCSGGPVSITADGASAGNAGNDGAGAGGAGGSIILQANAYTLNGSCPLTVSSGGGNGGSVNDGATHGGGAGGGKGVVILANTLVTPSNMSVSVASGTGGANSTAGGASTAGNGSTSASSGGNGVLYDAGRPLPVVLTAFAAQATERGQVRLSWGTAQELRSASFVVERLSAASSREWQPIGTVAGAGSSNSPHSYSFVDAAPKAGQLYYRLRQHDEDGSVAYSPVRSLRFDTGLALQALPNPSRSRTELTVEGFVAGTTYRATIHDAQGRLLQVVSLPTAVTAVSMEGWPAGLYLVRLLGGPKETVQATTKLVKAD